MIQRHGATSEELYMAMILDLAQKTLRGEVPQPPVGRLLGFVLKSIEPGRAVFEMEADERHHNPMGTLHGGIYCDLADATMTSWSRSRISGSDAIGRVYQGSRLMP